MSKIYAVDVHRKGKLRTTVGSLPDLIEIFSYTLTVGKDYETEKGNKKINLSPKTIEDLVRNLNNAKRNASRNGNPDTYYEVGTVEDTNHENFNNECVIMDALNGLKKKLGDNWKHEVGVSIEDETLGTLVHQRVGITLTPDQVKQLVEKIKKTESVKPTILGRFLNESFSQSYLEQTAKDYGIDLSIVKDIAKKANFDSMKFHELLEEYIKERSESGPHNLTDKESMFTTPGKAISGFKYINGYYIGKFTGEVYEFFVSINKDIFASFKDKQVIIDAEGMNVWLCEGFLYVNLENASVTSDKKEITTSKDVVLLDLLKKLND